VLTRETEIDQAGVFLPPPAPEKRSYFWHSRSTSSIASSQQRSVFSDAEPFNMSRESFDSYRRSFDISARSPLPYFSDSNLATRLSLESSKTSLEDRRRVEWPEDHVEKAPEKDEEDILEDVRLDDGVPQVMEQAKQADKVTPPKKKGLFARFGGDNESNGSGFFSSSKKRESDAELKKIVEPMVEVPALDTAQEMTEA